MTLGQKAVELARQSVGVSEEPRGSNWGKWIAVYLRFVGINFAAPWCVAFAMYKLAQAARALEVANLFPTRGLAARSCTYLARWAKARGRLAVHPPGYPCLFLVRARDGRTGAYQEGRYQHVGFWCDVDGNTIEGNSNDAGSAEGYEVAARTRSALSDRYHFVRI